MCSEMMNNRTKALFYDIDGTLLSEKTGRVPESAVQALKEARAKGHLVFINTGRVYAHLGEIKKLVEADGYLCGCGTYILAEGRVMYSYHIPHERGLEIKSHIDACGLDGALEASDGIHIHRSQSPIPRVEQMKASLRRSDCVSEYDWEDDSYDYDKFYLISGENSRPKELFGRLRDMEIIDRGNGEYECVPRGHSKATAIDLVFGDSGNDLAMFRYASNCILMGKHDEVLEPYATFETKDVEEDGIAYAMKELGII